MEEEFRKRNSGRGFPEGDQHVPFIGVNEGAPYCLNRPIFKGLNVKADLKSRSRKRFLFPTFTPLPLAASNNMGTTGSLGGPEEKTIEKLRSN